MLVRFETALEARLIEARQGAYIEASDNLVRFDRLSDALSRVRQTVPHRSTDKTAYRFHSKTVMSLSGSKKNLIRSAVAANLRPRSSVGGQTLLPVAPGSAGFVVLATKTGTLTQAGEFYYELTGKLAPSLKYDPNQEPVLKGSSAYITGRDGRSLECGTSAQTAK